MRSLALDVLILQRTLVSNHVKPLMSWQEVWWIQGNGVGQGRNLVGWRHVVGEGVFPSMPCTHRHRLRSGDWPNKSPLWWAGRIMSPGQTRDLLLLHIVKG